jgi:hypothetical protein
MPKRGIEEICDGGYGWTGMETCGAVLRGYQMTHKHAIRTQPLKRPGKRRENASKGTAGSVRSGMLGAM